MQAGKRKCLEATFPFMQQPREDTSLISKRESGQMIVRRFACGIDVLCLQLLHVAQLPVGM